MINGNTLKTLRWLTISMVPAALFGILVMAGQNAAMAGGPLLHKAALKSGLRVDNRQWTVAEAGGESRLLTLDGRWIAVTKGAVVVPGNQVKTGMTGHVLLKRPGDSVLISPNSHMTVPKRAGTHIMQSLGTLLFRITTRPDRPFNVKTPYMAAVIKGTVFTVAVNDNGAALHVTKGAVQVISSLTRQGVLVRPGQTATVDIRRGGRLDLANGRPRTGTIKLAKLQAAGGKRIIAKARGKASIDLYAATRGLVNKPSGRAGPGQSRNAAGRPTVSKDGHVKQAGTAPSGARGSGVSGVGGKPSPRARVGGGRPAGRGRSGKGRS